MKEFPIMHKRIIICMAAVILLVAACQKDRPTIQTPGPPSAPPKQGGPPPIEVATFEPPHKRIQTTRHIYCWNAEACPEYKFIPNEDRVPITEVEPGQLVKIRFTQGPKPSSIQVFVKPISQRIYATDEVTFSAPAEKGTFMYSVVVSWQSGKRGGMVEYFFRLKVQAPKNL